MFEKPAWFTAIFAQPIIGELYTRAGPKVGSRRYAVEIHSISVRAGELADITAQAIWLDAAGTTLVPAKDKVFGPRQKVRNQVLSFQAAGAATPVPDAHAFFLEAAWSQHRNALASSTPSPGAIRISLADSDHD